MADLRDLTGPPQRLLLLLAAALAFSAPAATARAEPPIIADGSGSCASRGQLVVCQPVADTPAVPGAGQAGAAVAARAAAGPAGPAAPFQIPPGCTEWLILGTENLDTDTSLQDCAPDPVQPATGAPASTASPAQAYLRAVGQLQMEPPTIGSAPCPSTKPGCKGAVGIPAWFWVDQGQWRARSASATAGPYTVNVTANPVAVTWNLGPGQAVITCHGPGTPYDLAYGWATSPDCGSTWTKVGDYQLTATIHWQVDWSGAITGQEMVATTSTQPVAIGEYQVVVIKKS